MGEKGDIFPLEKVRDGVRDDAGLEKVARTPINTRVFALIIPSKRVTDETAIPHSLLC